MLAKSDASNSLNPTFRKSQDIIDVEISTIDFEYANLDPKDYSSSLLMIDVESMEPSVLMGSLLFIKKFKPTIICEVLYGRNEKVLMKIFNSLTYDYFRFNGNEWVKSNTIEGDKSYIYRDWLFLPRSS